MNEKLISVIVPVYNVRETLEKCIDSIIRQTYYHLEIILINDGSTDGSGELCNEMKIKDNRIIVIHKENGGLSSARNAGMQVAHGEYVLFVDSDDWIDSRMITNLYELITKTKADLAMCGIISTDGKSEKLLPWFEVEKVFSQSEAMDELIANERVTSHAWNKLYKYSLIRDVPFPDGKLFEDIRMMHFVFKKCKRVAITNNYYYYYYVRSNSITTLPKLKNKLEMGEAFRDRYNDLKNIDPKYNEQLKANIALAYALPIIQQAFPKSEYKENEILLKRAFDFLKRKDVKRAVRRKLNIKSRLIVLSARIFNEKANRVYQVIYH